MKKSVIIRDLGIGTKIYYTGDMANGSGFFVVSAHRPGNYGHTIELRETGDTYGDEPRTFRGLMLSSFQPGPGRRFELHSEWKAEREAKIAAFAAAVRK